MIGPDPEDVGGMAELKWIAEYADRHGILVAPHGIFDGLSGLAAHVQMAATLPQNYIAFEYPVGQPEWWYEIVEGCPTQSPKVASSTFGTGPVSASRSMSRQLNPTYQTRIVTSSTETRLPQR